MCVESSDIILEDVMPGSPAEFKAGHIGGGGDPLEPADPAFAIASRFSETAVRSIQVLFVSHQPHAEAPAHALHDLKVEHAAPPHFPIL